MDRRRDNIRKEREIGRRAFSSTFRKEEKNKKKGKEKREEEKYDDLAI